METLFITVLDCLEVFEYHLTDGLINDRSVNIHP